MKKVYLIVIAIIFFSCSKQDEDCVCTGKFSNNTPDGTFFYVPNTKIDCATNQLIEQPASNPNALFWGCRD